MPAIEKYPETAAKEVAATNVTALVIRAPQCAVEAATCPVVRATGPGGRGMKPRRIGGRLTACAVPEAGGRSAVATVVDRVVAELVDWVVARLAGAVVAMVVGRVVAWVVASAVAIVVGAVVAIVVTTGLVDRRRALGKCPAASHAASRRRTFDRSQPHCRARWVALGLPVRPRTASSASWSVSGRIAMTLSVIGHLPAGAGTCLLASRRHHSVAGAKLREPLAPPCRGKHRRRCGIVVISLWSHSDECGGRAISNRLEGNQ